MIMNKITYMKNFSKIFHMLKEMPHMHKKRTALIELHKHQNSINQLFAVYICILFLYQTLPTMFIYITIMSVFALVVTVAGKTYVTRVFASGKSFYF